MHWNINPGIGCGDIQFGMTRTEVRKALPFPFKPFRKSLNSTIETDAYFKMTVHICYSSEYLVEAIEFNTGSNPVFNGKIIMGVPLRDVVQFLQGSENKIDVSDDGFIDLTHGISGYAPGSSKDSGKSIIQSVLVFKKGYYS